MAATGAPDITGIVLAGGEGRRMGGQDKGWLEINGKPMIVRVLERLQPQVSDLLISANRNLEDYRALKVRVVEDETPFCGPLGGISASLKAMQTEYAVIVPTDAPGIPPDLVQVLFAHLPARLILCRDEQRMQPLFGIYHRNLSESIDHFLRSGDRKLGLWCQQNNPVFVTIGDTSGFTNLNTPEDYEQFQKEKLGRDKNRT